MKILRTNNPGLRFLIDFWSKYCTLEPWHIEWARAHVKVHTHLRRSDMLYLGGERQKNVYLVARGMLARIQIDPDNDKRRLWSVALPGMALMTTDHLYSDTPSKGNIVVLRSGTHIVQIPYRAIREFKEQEPNIDTLIDVLGNKERKQMSQMLRIIPGNGSFDRCILFAKENPTLFYALYQQEIADMLQVSKSTVQSATYYLVFGKKRESNK